MPLSSSERVATFRSSKHTLLCKVNREAGLVGGTSLTINRVLAGPNTQGYGTEAAQQALHRRVQLPSVLLSIRMGTARSTRSSKVQLLDHATLKHSAIVRMLVAFLLTNADQLNLESVSVSSDAPEKDSIALVLTPKPRRVHTLAAVATPLRPETTEQQPALVIENEGGDAVHQLRLGLDLIWVKRFIRQNGAANRVDDASALQHAISQGGAVAPPLLLPLRRAYKQHLCGGILQNVNLRLCVLERKLLTRSDQDDTVYLDAEMPCFNGVWLDREETIAPYLRSLAQSLTSISLSADERHNSSSGAGASAHELDQRWQDMNERILAHIHKVPGLGADIEDANPRALRFLVILQALMSKDMETYDCTRIQPKIMDRISSTSMDAAYRLLYSTRQDSSSMLAGCLPHAQMARLDLIPFEASLDQEEPAKGTCFLHDEDEELKADVERDRSAHSLSQAQAELDAYSAAKAQRKLASAGDSSAFEDDTHWTCSLDDASSVLERMSDKDAPHTTDILSFKTFLKPEDDFGPLMKSSRPCSPLTPLPDQQDNTMLFVDEDAERQDYHHVKSMIWTDERADLVAMVDVADMPSSDVLLMSDDEQDRTSIPPPGQPTSPGLLPMATVTDPDLLYMSE